MRVIDATPSESNRDISTRPSSAQTTAALTSSGVSLALGRQPPSERQPMPQLGQGGIGPSDEHPCGIALVLAVTDKNERRLLMTCLVAQHHEYPTTLVAVDNRVGRGVAQPVQFSRRQLQVTATAGATDDVCRPDAAQLGPETLI